MGAGDAARPRSRHRGHYSRGSVERCAGLRPRPRRARRRRPLRGCRGRAWLRGPRAVGVRRASPTLTRRDQRRAPEPFRRSSHVRRTILVYGLIGGAVIAALKLAEYRFLVVEHSLEIYGGLVALVFAALGIWLGLKVTRPTERIIVREVPVPAGSSFVVRTESVE